jgi:hypothetical protein
MRKKEALWLFGSIASGCIKETSDVDLLHVTDYESHIPFALIQKYPATVAQYTWCDVQEMASYGSLFLHHVRDEGRPIFEGKLVAGVLNNVLDNLPTYKYVSRDIQSFQIAISDIRTSLRRSKIKSFELSNLAIVLRHAGILGCYALGQPKYGRDALRRLCALLGKPDVSIAQDYDWIYSFRLYAEHKVSPPPQPDTGRLLTWLGESAMLLSNLDEVCHEK